MTFILALQKTVGRTICSRVFVLQERIGLTGSDYQMQVKPCLRDTAGGENDWL